MEEDKDTYMEDDKDESSEFNMDLIPYAESSSDSSENFDHESLRVALARMFILDELPFKFVEREGFKKFMGTIAPRFQLPSHITLIKDCYQIYTDEKFKLKKLLSTVQSKISLSANIWTSTRNDSYLCLTANFIDDNWKLHRKILNFCLIPGEEGEEIGKLIESSVLHWGIENVGTLTMGNSGSNDVAVLYLKDKFFKENLPFSGEFFHIRCSANILNLIVRDSLDEVQTSVARIRDVVKYVWCSTSGAEKFQRCITKGKITSGSTIYLDVETRWSSTYFMLKSALNFQKAFEMLQEDDPEFVNDLDDGAPSIDDWNNARVLVRFLGIVYEVSKRFSGTDITSTWYFKLLCFIQFTLGEWAKSSDLHLQFMAIKMKERFNKYWGGVDETNMLLLISVALDPSCKVKTLRFYLNSVYPTETEKVDSLVNQVVDLMKRLFEHYKNIYLTSQHEDQDPSDIEVDQLIGGISSDKDDFHLKFKKFLEEQERADRELELQRYLEEGCERIGTNDDFDVLSQWEMFSGKYRILSKIAKDLLSIPVSTLYSTSYCSFENPALDEFRSSLTPTIVESLICAKNWLQTSPLPVEDEENLEELEKLESDINNLENTGEPSSSQG